MNHYIFDNFTLHTEASFEVTIDEKYQTLFEELSGDHNPLHLDDSFARARGFNGKVIYGMLVSSFYSTLVGMYLPGENCLINDTKISYHKPVYPGDHLTIHGEVTDLREGTQRAKISSTITNQNNELVSSAVITISFTKQSGDNDA